MGVNDTEWDSTHRVDETYHYADEVFDVCQCGDEEYGRCWKDTCYAQYMHNKGEYLSLTEWSER